VKSVYDCLKICRLTNDCHFVSYKENKERCHLKNEDAPAGAVVDLNYISAEKCCDDESCLIRGKEFEDSGWLVKTRYDIISNSYAASVPNVNSTSDCHDICEIVDSCNFWTYELPEKNCYLVRTNRALEYSSDKISGSRGCCQGADCNGSSSMEPIWADACPDITSDSSSLLSSDFDSDSMSEWNH